MKISKYITCIFLAALSASCDRFTDINFIGKNNTDKNVVVTFYNSTQDSTVIELSSGETYKDLTTRNHVGVGKTFNCCPCMFDRIKIVEKSSIYAITKDINVKETWVINVKKKHTLSKVPKKVECTFELNQSDIQ